MITEPMEQEYDIADQARQKLMSVIPEAFADGKILWEKLRESLGDMLDDDDETAFEHYGLNWPGKRKAKKIAATPSTLTLTPLKGEGIDEDTTENIFIEGDNLEVLKILYKSYKEKIKMIYIDPPYNTGNDFVYNDDFRMTEDEFMRAEGSVDEHGNKLVANKKTSGRFHANWLNMMYPRLKIARELLKEDGAIFVSIDDNEVHNLRLLCDEIFGEENYLANIVWKHTQQSKNDEPYFSRQYNSLISYRKSPSLKQLRFPRSEEDNRNYSNPDNDPNGDWRSGDVRSPNFRATLHYPILTPSGNIIQPPENGWRWSEDELKKKIESGEIKFNLEETKIIRKIYLKNQDGRTPENVWIGDDFGTTRNANNDMKDLFDGYSPFDTPKPTNLISKICQLFKDDKSFICMDFFAGSGTTAHALMKLNSEDNGHRKCISVQLPEPVNNGKYLTIAEIGKERIRRASETLQEYNPQYKGDLGFKVYKTTRSNHKKWGKYSITAPKEADSLFAVHQHSLIDDWEYDSVITEIILTEGFTLTSKIETFDSVTTNQIARISDPDKEYVLYACLDEHINSDTIKALNMNDNDIFICLGSAIDDQNLSALHDKGRIRTL